MGFRRRVSVVQRVLSILIVALLTACTASKVPAPIADITATIDAKTMARTVENGRYVVKQGDNLYRIAVEFDTSYRDLALWNHLENVDDIKVGQVLRLTAPKESSLAMSSKSIAIKDDAAIKTKVLTSNELTSSPLVTEPKTTASETSSSIASLPNIDGQVLKMQWPTKGKVVQSFGKNAKGIDIAGRLGQDIVAASDGSVVYVGSGLPGYGKMIILKHNKTHLTAYAHNNKLLVKEGEIVKQGQKIAEMGNTDADSVKLHFEVRRFGKPVDPTKYLT